MLRNLRFIFVTACLTLATMLALTGNVSKAAANSSTIRVGGILGWGSTPFLRMNAKGEVSVDDADNPTKLSSDLKSTFRLGPNSNGLNPLKEDLKLHLQYEAVGPMYDVFVPAGCLTQVGKSYLVGMQDIHTCGLSIQLASPNNEIVELLPYIERFDLRLTPGPRPKAEWDLNLSIDLASTQKGPLAAIIAVLRSPTRVKLAIGDDDGEVTIGRIEFSGDN